MLTILAIPKPFQGHINITQRNAIQSWLLLRPKCEVILFGNEIGTAETAAEFGIRHIPEVACNEFGSPIISDLIKRGLGIASFSKITYVSSDIIFLNDFAAAVESIKEDCFLAVGQRWDVDIKEPINFIENDWEEKLRFKVSKEGRLHPPSAVDYPVFSRKLLEIMNMPPFIVGRPGADSWFIYCARALKVPVIDITEAVTAVHQNHDYRHHSQGKKGVWRGEEAKRNFRLAGGFSHMATIRDSDWALGPKGLKKPKFSRIIISKLTLFYPWRLLLLIKRRLQNF